jgi:hypothetical protein
LPGLFALERCDDVLGALGVFAPEDLHDNAFSGTDGHRSFTGVV